MKADEWLYLCVAHGGNAIEECCAIDYILHTYVAIAVLPMAINLSLTSPVDSLDSTTTLLNSTKNFPSRYVSFLA